MAPSQVENFPTKYWHPLENGRIQCDVCPRRCQLQEGQRGLCFVRAREKNQIVLTSYGQSSGFCIDPIEKKPLFHFLPGTPVLSFGTAGCNLACQFCQNWDISKSREVDSLSASASPQEIAKAALQHECRSVAFTYNDPIVFMEYAMDVAKECHKVGLKTVAVTSGYILEEPRKEFYSYIDAANVDLKGFTEDFYNRICSGRLQDVLDTLLYIRHQTNVWLEITTLLIPGENDSSNEIEALCKWINENLGSEVPLHFTAFHPDWRMMDKKPTPPSTLQGARKIALNQGLRYVYTGNIANPQGETTFCSHCQSPVIKRDRYSILEWNLTSQNKCRSCQNPIPGHFESSAGNWGSKRQPISIA
jgi:pyruvate formate lyase activating enzyme